MSTVEDYPKNPDYGHGRYRRRIRLTSEPGQVHGELEDTNHGFRCTIFHDGEKVTDIQSEVLRIPFDTCPGAVEPLRKLIGLALCDDIQTLIPLTDSSSNCTHLLDLALLAIRHSRRSVAELIYDICVEDQADDNSPAAAEVYANGKLLHRWQTCNWEITGPDELKHKVLYKGFSKWASACFTGEEREAAFILQKGYFVASARRYNIDAQVGQAANEHRDVMLGVCFSYSTPQIEIATRTADSTRDFSNTPELLLKFQEVN
ncbi:DUF2889 domain-containing protein [Zhongshania sp.]|jgi:hypothetical protein|uniref:DUF2889 domain-containing protein n=1 Tax=Zhongshania sp. TaxID=1971902 RepID=UPI002A8318C7|nr:DUF2889 domain-containing protein [Zhongshania sp.]